MQDESSWNISLVPKSKQLLNNNKKEQTPICEGVSKGHDSQLKESPMTKAGTT
jgi:hypothetical protein